MAKRGRLKRVQPVRATPAPRGVGVNTLSLVDAVILEEGQTLTQITMKETVGGGENSSNSDLDKIDRNLKQVQAGEIAKSQTGGSLEDWHVVASKRRGSQRGVIKRTEMGSSSTAQIIGKSSFDRLQSNEAFDLAELRVPPDLGVDDSRGLEHSRSQ
ncbi:hypothetical protein Dimus_021331 [Dionaea muscipula]